MQDTKVTSDKYFLEKPENNFTPNQRTAARTAAIFGLIAGLAMSFYLLIVNAVVDDYSVGWRFLKYAIYIVIAGFAASYLKGHLNKGNRFFKNGIIMTVSMAFVAAFTVVAINIVLSVAGFDLAAAKYGFESEDGGTEFYLVNAVLWVEIFIVCTIFTFPWLQYFKE